MDIKACVEFGHEGGQSQRDCVFQPKVGVLSYLGKHSGRDANLEEVAALQARLTSGAIVLKTDLEMTDSEAERAAIIANFKNIKTRAEARAYAMQARKPKRRGRFGGTDWRRYRGWVAAVFRPLIR